MDLSEEDFAEIIATYFANTYWNSLYVQARENHMHHKIKLQEAYTEVAENYSRAFGVGGENKHYMVIMKDICEYFGKHTGQPMMFGRFLNMVAGFIIPQRYQKDAGGANKRDLVVKTILSKTLARFTVFAAHNYIGEITNPSTRRKYEKVVKLKDKYREILNTEINEFSGLVLAHRQNVDIHDRESGNINKDIYRNMQNKIHELIKEKNQIAKERNQYMKLAQAYRDIIEKNKRQSAAAVPQISKTEIPAPIPDLEPEMPLPPSPPSPTLQQYSDNEEFDLLEPDD